MNPSLVARLGDLKLALVEYGMKFQKGRPLKDYLGQNFDPAEMTPDSLFDSLDCFFLNYSLPDGSTIVENFVNTYPGLSREEKEILLSWRYTFPALLEIKRYKDGGLICYNWINDKTYHVFATKPIPKSEFPKGYLISTRISPAGGFHLLSGSQEVRMKPGRGDLEMLIVSIVGDNHLLQIVDNEERIKKCFELQEKDREEFVEYFGSDEVTGTGEEIFTKYDEWRHWQSFVKIRENNMTRGEAYRKKSGWDYEPPDIDIEDDWRSCHDLTMIYDKLYGLDFFEDYGRLLSILENPTEKSVRKNRLFLEDWLAADCISPNVIERIARNRPEGFCLVMKTVFKFRECRPHEYLEQFLAKYKKRYHDWPIFPTIDYHSVPCR